MFVFFVVVYAGIAGTDAQSENLAPTAVYVGFWIGIPFLSLLFGDVFRLFNPWRALGRATGWIASRFSDELPEPLEYPERLGRLPAAIGLLCFAICELCWADATQPGPLALIMLVYFVAMLVGMSLYGVEPWVRNGDAFGVLFGLFGSLSPIGRGEDGRSTARSRARRRRGSTRSRHRRAARHLGRLDRVRRRQGRPAVQRHRAGAAERVRLARVLARHVARAGVPGRPVVAIAVVGAIWTLGLFGMPLPPSVPDRRALARAFGHTLIPISAGYMVAHYFSLLAYNGQNLWPLANDPLGKGSDLFGGAAAGIDYGIVSATGIWYVQVGALVVGHVAGLVLAHDRALEVYGSARAATRSQIVMLILMVAFTCSACGCCRRR